MPATKNSLIDDKQRLHDHIQKVHMESVVKEADLAIAISLDRGARENLIALWERYGIASHAKSMIAEQKRKFLVKISAANTPGTLNMDANDAISELLAWQYTSVRMGNLVVRIDKIDRRDRRLLNSYETEIEKRVSAAIKRESRTTTKLREEARALRNRIKRLEKENDNINAVRESLEEKVRELEDKLNEAVIEKDRLKNSISNSASSSATNDSMLDEAAKSKISTELDKDLPVPIAFALSHLHLIPDINDPRSWHVGPDDAPNATCWNTLMLAAMAKEKFAQEVMSELTRVKRERDKFNRDKEVKELAARLKSEAEIEALKVKAKLQADGGLEADDGLGELDDIMIDDEYDTGSDDTDGNAMDGSSLNVDNASDIDLRESVKNKLRELSNGAASDG